MQQAFQQKKQKKHAQKSFWTVLLSTLQVMFKKQIIFLKPLGGLRRDEFLKISFCCIGKITVSYEKINKYSTVNIQ